MADFLMLSKMVTTVRYKTVVHSLKAAQTIMLIKLMVHMVNRLLM